MLRDESDSELFGQEEWGRMLGEHEREWQDYLCGNHSRNLHFDAFLRLFEGYIKVLPLDLSLSLIAPFITLILRESES